MSVAAAAAAAAEDKAFALTLVSNHFDALSTTKYEARTYPQPQQWDLCSMHLKEKAYVHQDLPIALQQLDELRMSAKQDDFARQHSRNKLTCSSSSCRINGTRHVIAEHTVHVVSDWS